MKIRLITLLLFLCSLHFGKAQNRAIGFGAAVSLDYPKVLLKDDNPGSASGKVSYSAGLRLLFPAASGFQLITGADYQIVRFSLTDYTAVTFGCDHDGQGSAVLTNSWMEGDYIREFIAIPLEARIRLTPGENHLFLQAGGKGLFWARDKQNVRFFPCGLASDEEAINPFLEKPAKFSAIGSIALGIRAAMGRQSAISFGAKFDYFTGDIYNTGDTRARLLAAGVELGFSF